MGATWPDDPPGPRRRRRHCIAPIPEEHLIRDAEGEAIGIDDLSGLNRRVVDSVAPNFTILHNGTIYQHKLSSELYTDFPIATSEAQARAQFDFYKHVAAKHDTYDRLCGSEYTRYGQKLGCRSILRVARGMGLRAALDMGLAYLRRWLAVRPRDLGQLRESIRRRCL